MQLRIILLISCAYTLQVQVWAFPGGSDEIASLFHELVPEMALDFPFVLDKFQKEV